MVVRRFRQYMVSERWVQTLRDSVADAGFADGWSVMNRNGKVQVSIPGSNQGEHGRKSPPCLLMNSRKRFRLSGDNSGLP